MDLVRAYVFDERDDRARLDDEGSSVSMVRQLITIARAFLARPAILNMHDATSSLATLTEVLNQHGDETVAPR